MSPRTTRPERSRYPAQRPDLHRSARSASKHRSPSAQRREEVCPAPAGLRYPEPDEGWGTVTDNWPDATPAPAGLDVVEWYDVGELLHDNDLMWDDVNAVIAILDHHGYRVARLQPAPLTGEERGMTAQDETGLRVALELCVDALSSVRTTEALTKMERRALERGRAALAADPVAEGPR